MMNRLDGFAADLPETAVVASRDQFIDRAYDLLTSRDAQEAFNLDREDAAVRDRYGRTTLGQSCLLARRLIEAGVGFVTVNDQGVGPAGLGYAPAELPVAQGAAGAAAGPGSLSALVATWKSVACWTRRWWW